MFSPGVKQDEIFRVIYAGTLSVQKGIHYLVNAFNLAAIPDSELCLVGSSGSETPILLKNANSRVKKIGHVPQSTLVNYYRNSSVFVMPSVQDGFGLVQAQAMASGLPLVCSSNTGGEDLLRIGCDKPYLHRDGILEFPAGFLVPARNSLAIAYCLRLLFENPGLLRAKREAALEARSHSLSWSSYGERAIAAYEHIC
jgi:glycosyltransferase involved in cell wall biosynthesis